MTFDSIQSYFAGLLSADSQIGPLGTPIQVDPFADPEAAKSAIATQLRVTGVSIEVGFPFIGAPETLLGGSTHIDATCELYVAEHTQQAHTPAKAALVTRVITTCTKPPGTTGQKPARLRSSESVKTDGGYILHMLSFFVPMNIKQP